MNAQKNSFLEEDTNKETGKEKKKNLGNLVK